MQVDPEPAPAGEQTQLPRPATRTTWRRSLSFMFARAARVFERCQSKLRAWPECATRTIDAESAEAAVARPAPASTGAVPMRTTMTLATNPPTRVVVISFLLFRPIRDRCHGTAIRRDA